LLVLEERLKEQKKEGVRLPEGMDVNELASLEELANEAEVGPDYARLGWYERVYVSMWIESRIACSSRKSSSDVADRYWVRNTWR
jgi:hypothetical protein